MGLEWGIIAIAALAFLVFVLGQSFRFTAQEKFGWIIWILCLLSVVGILALILFAVIQSTEDIQRWNGHDLE